jgi:hypothetical protein
LSFLDSEVEECFVFDIISEAPESEKAKILRSRILSRI